jgi:hypothetical protein
LREDAVEHIYAVWPQVNKARLSTILDIHFGRLISAAEHFVEKVESGRAQSVESYRKFKDALGS